MLCCFACHELLAPLDTYKLQHWLMLLAEMQAGAESHYYSVSVHTFHLQVFLSASASVLTYSDFKAFC